MKKEDLFMYFKELKRFVCKWTCKGSSIFTWKFIKCQLNIRSKGGELLLEKKVRKIQKCREYIKMSLKKNYLKVLHMFHANDKDGAEEWISDIRQAFPEMDFKLYPLPISFAVHAGEGTIAISY